MFGANKAGSRREKNTSLAHLKAINKSNPIWFTPVALRYELTNSSFLCNFIQTT